MGPIDDWGRGDRLYRLVGAWVGDDLTEIPPGPIVVGVQSPPDWAQLIAGVNLTGVGLVGATSPIAGIPCQI